MQDLILSSMYLVVFLVFMGSLLYAFSSLAPWVPSYKRDFERIFSLIDLQPHDIFYDLGCGDGRLVFGAAKRGAKAKGIELALPMYLVCKLKELVSAGDTAFYWRNALKHDLSDATVVYLFGLPKTNANKLQKKLERELNPGAKVISYAFTIGDWVPVEKNKPQKNDFSIYLYIV